MRIAIIGGGMAGLGAAYELAKTDHTVVLYEKQSQLGGLSASLKIGDSYLEVYYHHLFPHYKDIIELSEKMGIEDKLFFRPAKTGTIFQNKFWSFNGALDLLRFKPLSFINRVRAGFAFLYLKLVKDHKRFVGISATDWLLRWFGQEGYKVLWKPLLASKFGKKADTISMVWLWGRIYERPRKFGYFHGGIKTFVSALEKYLKNNNIDIRTNNFVKSIEKKNNTFVISANGKEQEFDHVIITAPPQPFLKLTQAMSLPEDFIKSVSNLHYAGTVCGVMVLNQHLTDYYWTNISDEDSPFVAIVEQTNFIDSKEYGGLHPVYLGRYLDRDHPFYSLTDDEIWKQFLKKVKQINPSFSEDWISEKHLFRAPFTQPVAPVNYHKIRPRFTTPIDNLWWASMSHVYPWDRGIDHSLKVGREFVKEILLK